MWELVSYAQGHTRKVCLESLSAGPKTPNAIVRATGIHLSHVSRALRELSGKDLVECITPALTKNRIYRITNKGKEVLKKLKEIG